MKRTIKDLENEFSWAQFHQNSHQLSVQRYPRRYKTDINPANGIKTSVMDVPYTDSIMFEKAQENILQIKKEVFGN